VAPEVRDDVVGQVEYWSRRTRIPQATFVDWVGVPRSTFFDWRRRRGKPNEHNSDVPRSFWLLPWEKQAILDYQAAYPDVGYRRMTYQMIDDNIVAVSPASVYRVLAEEERLKRWKRKTTGKGTGFAQPSWPHRHWHIDVSHVNVAGTFFYLCTVIDGYSRYITAWDLRESMTERDVEIVLQRAREAFPHARPRIISDNGPAFIAGDFKEFIRVAGFTHVRTSPFYPQSNGKMERWYGTAKEFLRRKTPLTFADARRLIAEFVVYYNDRRLHSALEFVPPKAVLEGRAEAIIAERVRRLEEAAALRSATWIAAA
jgi:transposase InsO family protein